MTFQDYIKFLTERLVRRMDKQTNQMEENNVNKDPDIYINHWFGLFPLSWKLWRTK